MKRVKVAAVAVALVTSVVVPEAEAAAGCQVTYEVTNEWQGGFIGDVKVTNLGDALTGWRLT
ncbi:MAG TPA: cellulose binding domain-containing protein, partial [Lentzea sp.]